MHRLLVVTIELGSRIREEASAFVTHYNCGIIRISREHILAINLVGIANHAEQGMLLIFTVERPAGIKYFMSTVFRVGLSKHHQLNIGWVAI